MNSKVDLTSATWSKSSYSNGQSACVEVAGDFPGAVPVRDSKTQNGEVLVFPTHGWASFLTALKSGQLGD